MPDADASPKRTAKPTPKSKYGAWLVEHRASVSRRREDAAASESRTSLARLGAFLFAAIAWYPLSALAPAGLPALAVGLAAVVGGVVAFAFAIGVHVRHKARRDGLDRELAMIDESTRRCTEGVVLIRSRERPADAEPHDPDPESQLAAGRNWPLTDQERDDLDLYSAPVGLFGLLNRTSTDLGARRLRDLVEAPLIDSAALAERRAAVRWLAERSAERLRFMGAVASLRPEHRSLRLLRTALRTVAPLHASIPLPALRIWSILSAVGILAALSQVMIGAFGWSAVLLILLMINGALFFPLRGRIRAQLDVWQSVQPALRGLSESALVSAAELPSEPAVSPILAAIRQRLAAAAQPNVLPAIARRVGWTEHGGMMHELFNLIGLFDLHIAAGLLRHAVPGRAAIVDALAAVADLESLCSLAAFAAEQPDSCWPVEPAEAGVEILDGYHALLDPGAAVPNSMRLTPARRVWVVTGSNMAGKSTFLRMTAVNVLLAQVGTVAVAASMRASPVRLITDLRTRDNLAKAESYFLAEVRHLRRMVCPPVDPVRVLGLIDEPLRGTNSAEQIAASLAVVEHLMTSGHFFMVATHDQKITELAHAASPAANFHFEERLDGNGLSFDYRLREGPARTRNALRVLEQEGFPPELMASARDWLARGEESAGAPAVSPR